MVTHFMSSGTFVASMDSSQRVNHLHQRDGRSKINRLEDTNICVCMREYIPCVYICGVYSALRKAPTNITCMLNTIVPCSAQSANNRHPATIETTPSCICPAQSADNIHLATSETMPNCVCPAQRANSTYEHNAT